MLVTAPGPCGAEQAAHVGCGTWGLGSVTTRRGNCEDIFGVVKEWIVGTNVECVLDICRYGFNT